MRVIYALCVLSLSTPCFAAKKVPVKAVKKPAISKQVRRPYHLPKVNLKRNHK